MLSLCQPCLQRRSADRCSCPLGEQISRGILSGQGAARAWGFGTPAGRAPGIQYTLSYVGDRGSAGRGGGGGPAEGLASSCTVLNRTLVFLGLLRAPKDLFVVSLLFRFYRPGQVASCAAETLTTSYRRILTTGQGQVCLNEPGASQDPGRSLQTFSSGAHNVFHLSNVWDKCSIHHTASIFARLKTAFFFK